MEAKELILVRDVVVRFFDPLAKATTSPEEARRLLVQLGYDPPAEVTAFQDLSAAVSAVDALITAIEELPEDPDEEAIATAALQSLPAVAAIVVGLERFTTSIQDNFAGSPFLTQTDIVAEIARKLLDHLVVRALEDYYKTLGASLELVGLIEIEDMEVAASPFETAYRKRTVHWDRLPELFSDPIGLVLDNLTSADEVYVYRILYLLGELAVSLGLPAGFRSPDEPALRLFNDGADLFARDDADQLTTLHLPLIEDPLADLALQLYPVRDAGTGKYTGIAAAVSFGSTIDIPLGDRFHLLVKLSAIVADGLGMKLSRAGGFTFSSSLFSGTPANLADSVQLGARVGLESVAASERKLVSLGTPGGMQFEIGSGSLALGIEKLDRVRFFVETELKQGKLVLKSSDADGFLAKLLPADGITTEFNLGLGIANDAGLYFIGSSGLEIRLPLHLALGPVEIQYLTLGATFKAGEIPVTAATGISAKLGPLGAAVEDVGVKATFVVKGDRSGNLGPVDVAFGFKPPNGVGLSIDAGVVKGGGFLFFDSDRGEYAGALELTIADFLSLKAIGLDHHAHAGRQPGLLAAGHHHRGVQPGPAARLRLHADRRRRPARAEPHRACCEALALGRPHRRGRTASCSRATWSPTRRGSSATCGRSSRRSADRFLIGPMAKLGWGTPTLISLSLGVIIEIPGNVAILGVLKRVAADEDAAVLAAAGQLHRRDRVRQEARLVLRRAVRLAAALHHDRGRDGRAGRGRRRRELRALGRRLPPALLAAAAARSRRPRRIALDIIDTSVARIRAEGYFAVTTNTVQFGARAELFFGFDALRRRGAPRRSTRSSASRRSTSSSRSPRGASLKAFGVGVFSIDLAFTLEGPTPWRARGTRLGQPAVRQHLGRLRRDVGRGDATRRCRRSRSCRSARSELEQGRELARARRRRRHNLLVSLRKLDLPGDTLVLHPLGTLEVSQNAMPLGITLDRVGAQQPSDANRFALDVAVGGLTQAARRAPRLRARAVPQPDDAQKLVRAGVPGRRSSGIELGVGGAELRTGHAVKRSLRYEVTTIDTLYRRFVRRFARARRRVLFAHFVKGAAIAQAPVLEARRDAGAAVRRSHRGRR